MQPNELARRLDEVQVVDVRFPNEWEAGRIHGARHVPLDQLEDRQDEIDPSRPVVTVCRSGTRSAQAADRLRDEGFDAENLDGGMLAWADAGLPVTTPDGSPGTVAEPEEPVEPEEPAGEGPEADPGFQAAVVELALEVQEHFGDHEPSEDEVRGYLRDRLIREGHTAEEADEVLARLPSDAGPSA
ncbi:MAG: rhodanese-like domain-containing protein [Actinomycetota bacterium]|nr:rhodanese-like domain-containing protein [Actinomycetota bacterium]